MRGSTKLVVVMTVLILLVSAVFVYAQVAPAAQPQQAPVMQTPQQMPGGQPPGMGAMAPRPTSGMMGMPGMPGMMGGMMGQAPTMVVQGDYIFILRGDQLIQYQVANPKLSGRESLVLIAQTTLPQPPPRMAPPPPGTPQPPAGAPQGYVPSPTSATLASAKDADAKQAKPTP